ncbi:MAG: nicotinamide-nucleotide amidohydrolase family protein [Clostridia bacterium]|nr:nicotinamide-nucleotide amidohydrolase family protein [Clostridia bacterium]
MKTEFIFVSDELLDGALVGSAPQKLNEEMYKNGYDIKRQSFIRSDKKEIITTLAAAIKRSQMILIIGGLGGSKNDITKESVCDALGITLEENTDVYSDLYERFANTQSEEMLHKQSAFPKGAVLFRNKLGSQYGFAVNSATQHIVFLPYADIELCDILNDSAKEYFTLYCDDKNTVTRILISNTTIAEVTQELSEELETGIVRIVNDKSYVCVLILLKKGSRTLGEKIIKKTVKRFGVDVCGIDSIGSEESVVNQLKKKKLTVSVAESCTGGLVAKRITDISGASNVLGYSVVCYNEEIKKKELGVREQSLKEYTVVSEKVSEEMALGVKIKSGADIGISVTGVAGPDSDEYGNEVGLVFCSLTDGKYMYTKKERFNEELSREQIRERAATTILDLVRLYLLALPGRLSEGVRIPAEEIERVEAFFEGRIIEQELEDTPKTEEDSEKEEQTEIFKVTISDEEKQPEIDLTAPVFVDVSEPEKSQNNGEEPPEDPFGLKFM